MRGISFLDRARGRGGSLVEQPTNLSQAPSPYALDEYISLPDVSNDGGRVPQVRGGGWGGRGVVLAQNAAVAIDHERSRATLTTGDVDADLAPFAEVSKGGEIGLKSLPVRPLRVPSASRLITESAEALTNSGEPPGNRTPNPQIKSLLLCQLS